MFSSMDIIVILNIVLAYSYTIGLEQSDRCLLAESVMLMIAWIKVWYFMSMNFIVTEIHTQWAKLIDTAWWSKCLWPYLHLYSFVKDQQTTTLHSVQAPERISAPCESQFKSLLLRPGWTPLCSQPCKAILESLSGIFYIFKTFSRGLWNLICSASIYISITIFKRIFNKN